MELRIFFPIFSVVSYWVRWEGAFEFYLENKKRKIFKAILWWTWSPCTVFWLYSCPFYFVIFPPASLYFSWEFFSNQEFRLGKKFRRERRRWDYLTHWNWSWKSRKYIYPSFNEFHKFLLMIFHKKILLNLNFHKSGNFHPCSIFWKSWKKSFSDE